MSVTIVWSGFNLEVEVSGSITLLCRDLPWRGKLPAMIRVDDVCRTYSMAGRSVEALRGVALSVPESQFLALMGPSGCGKSTLLHLIGGLDRPTSGTVFVAGRDLGTLDETGLSKLRQADVSIVFQFFNLLPTLTVIENVMLPAILQQGASASVRDRAAFLLESVGMTDRRDHGIQQISGGEQQRAAIARALMIQPRVLLADEPTGNLDSVAGEQVLEVLSDLPGRFGTTLVMVTHSEDVARRADRIVRMRDGRIIGDQSPELAVSSGGDRTAH